MVTMKVEQCMREGRNDIAEVLVVIESMSNQQASLDRDISLKALNSLFKATIEVYLRFLGIVYLKMCHDRQLSAVLAPVPSYACSACSGELIRATSWSMQYDNRPFQSKD